VLIRFLCPRKLLLGTPTSTVKIHDGDSDTGGDHDAENSEGDGNCAGDNGRYVFKTRNAKPPDKNHKTHESDVQTVLVAHRGGIEN